MVFAYVMVWGTGKGEGDVGSGSGQRKRCFVTDWYSHVRFTVQILQITHEMFGETG